MAKKKLTSAKAKEMLHNPPHGKPLTDKQRKFFGAVANAQKGKKVNQEEPVWTELSDMPEVVVLNIKDKATKELYDKELEALPITSKSNPYAGRKEFADYYAKMQMAKNYGVPNVRPAEPLGDVANFFRDRAGIRTDENKPWPSYNPFTKTINADFNNYQGEYLPELSHYVSSNIDSTKNYLKRGLLTLGAYAIGKNPYRIEGTEEYVAHNEIAPSLLEEYQSAVNDARQYAFKSAYNSQKRNLKEKKNKLQEGGIESTMGGLTDKGFNYNGAWGGAWQMGGSLPGVTGNMYARVGAPSNGKYAKKTKASAQKGKKVKLSASSGPDMSYNTYTTPPEMSANADFMLGTTLDTGVDQIPGANYILAANAFNQGLPLTGVSELVKVPFSIYGDAAMNASQENPSGFDIKTLEKKIVPWARLAANAFSRNPIISQIGEQMVKSGKNSKGYYNLPTLTEAADKYNVDNTDFVQFIQDNWDATGNDWKKVLEMADKKLPKKQNGGEMRFYQEGLDFTPKTISQDGAIVDPMGQWAHPGEITRIPSNDITMEGVPYPVLGVSDNGDTKMMFPNKNYTFDGSYVTEYPMAQNGTMQDKGQLKKLDQLTNFTNYNKMAKKGIKKAQYGDIAKLSEQMGLKLASYNKGMFDSPTGSVSKVQTQQLGFDDLGNKIGGGNLNAAGLISAGSDVIKGIQQLKQDKLNAQKAKQFSKLSGVVAQAATSRDQMPKRKYVRPEDMLFSNSNITNTPYGTGYDVLQSAENGMQIGGNLTEIQNMYNPGTLYDDLGYEPLDDSSKVKQFADGGNLFSSDFFSGLTQQDASTFGGFLGSSIGGNKGRTSGAGSIGKGLGSVAGTIIGGPIGGMIGSTAGAFIGDLIGGQQAAKAEQQMKEGQRKLNQASIQQAVGGLQNQFSAYMEDGGETSGLKYLSNDWQPQVITTFGDYKLKNLLAPPSDADMLRTGGNIRQNYMSDDERLSMMQLGGELQTHWGGDAEVMSQNPYIGETLMFKGQSHDESDGKGRTGIGITFGESPVEVERGEPAIKMKDGGTGDDSLVVYGDMKIPSYGVSELGDPNAKGMKFKHYVRDLSKDEEKQNKKKDKAINLTDSVSGDDPFDLLKINSAKATLTGVDMKLKDIANKKKVAAGIQNAILDTAEQFGLESSDLAKGNIKPIKGAKGKAQNGKVMLPSMGLVDTPTTPAYPFQFGPYKLNQPVQDFEKRWEDYRYDKPLNVSAPYISADAEYRAKQEMAKAKAAKDALAASSENETYQQPKQPGFAKQLARELLPYVRPTNQMPLDPSQLSGEMFALATNTLEPVQAQTYQPILKTVPGKRSAQTALNQNQLTFNALARQIGGNPQALAQLAAQKYDADKQVISQTEDYNRAAEAQVMGENINALNDSTLKNLAILDTQYQRQTGAKSATKAQAQAALSSIASKIAQNKLENRTLGVYENMYNYRFTPSGTAYNVNAPAEFNIPNVADYSSEDLLKLAKEKKEKETKSKEKSRNGNIVKAIKGL